MKEAIVPLAAIDPLRILAGFRAHGVSYILIGDLAASVRGAPPNADGIDVCVPGDADNLARLALALLQLGAELGNPTSEGDHQASYATPFGRLGCLESTLEFAALQANASNEDLGHGVIVRVAALDDLARLKRTSIDLEGAVRLAALAETAGESGEEAEGPVDPDIVPNSRIDRFLERLGGVDVFLTNLNNGQLPPRKRT